jgi:beta-lactamase class A
LTAGATALACAGVARAAQTDELAAIERATGGRFGLFALDTGSGRSLAHRADERFLMCSTFKTLAAADVLARVDAGRERLDRRIAFGEKDLLEYAPVTREHVKDGFMSVEALCEAAVEVSDNTAANLLLASLGGPAGLTEFVRRRIGDRVTRMDRIEPVANRPDGDKDTTSPRAMAGSVRRLLLGDVLGAASRTRLEGWLRAAKVGLTRTRAGLPSDWIVGNKTGNGNTEVNDVVFARPPGRAPVILAGYCNRPGGADDATEAAFRAWGVLVARWIAAGAR